MAEFTQEQLNEAVDTAKAGLQKEHDAAIAKLKETATAEARTAVEKELGEKYKDYDTFKASHEQLGKLNEEQKTLKEELESIRTKQGEAEDTIKTTAESMVQALPEDKRGMVHETLTPADKIKYILEHGQHLGLRQIPQTPGKEPGTEGKGKKYGPNGEYETLQEWADKDHKTYLAFRKSGGK